jgi:hypothetical protein
MANGGRVSFRAAHRGASAGSSVCVVGSVPELGGWRPEHAVRLEPAVEEPGVFAATLALAMPSPSPAEPPQYKYLIRDARGAVRWEQGPNRDLPLPARRTDDGGGPPQDLLVLRDVVRAEGASEHAGFEWPVEACDVGEASTAMGEKEEEMIVKEEEMRRQHLQLEDPEKKAAGAQAHGVPTGGGPVTAGQPTPGFRGHDQDTPEAGDCSTKAAAALSRKGAAHGIRLDEDTNHSQSTEATVRIPGNSTPSAGEVHDAGNNETSNGAPQHDGDATTRTIMVTFSHPSSTAPREPPVYLVDRLKKTLFGSE